jgi:hypothetical protein
LVRIKEGPLEGIEGILVRKKNSFRLVLSVELVQKSISMEVDARIVERVRCAKRGSEAWVAAAGAVADAGYYTVTDSDPLRR